MNDSNQPLGRRIVRGLAAVLSANVLGSVLKGLIVLALARYLLAPDEYGLLFLALSVVLFVQMFASLGLPRSAARYVSEYRETDPGQVPHIIRTALAYNVVTIVAFGAGMALFAEPIAGLVGEPRLVPFLRVGTLLVAATALTVFVRTLFQGLNQVQYSALTTVVLRSGELLLVVGLVVLTGEVMGAFVGYVLGAVLGATVGGALLYRRFYSQFEPAATMEPGLARRIFEYNLPLMTSRGAGALLSKTDVVLVGFFWNPAVVGFYVLGLQIAEFVATPAKSLGYVISPTFGERKASDDLGTAASVYEESFRHTLALYVPAAVGLFILADPAITLVFGEEYANAVPVVRMLTVFVVLKAVNAITNTTLDYLGVARLRAYAKVAGAALNVLLNVVLIPEFGAIGAAIATVATYGMLVGINVALLLRTLPLSVRRMVRTNVLVTLVGAGMGLVVFPAAVYVSSLPTLVAVVALGAVVWGVLVVASGLLDLDSVSRALTSFA
jgi:O-antigen/teichoic acid export membrane protein